MKVGKIMNFIYRLFQCYIIIWSLILNSTPGHSNDGNKEFQLNKRVGLAYLDAGEHKLAIERLTIALQMEPDDIETLMGLGSAYALNKEYDKAIRLYKGKLEKEPENIWVRYKLGEVLSWAKKYDEAIEEYKKILKSESNNKGVRLNLGEVYCWQAKDEKKEDLLDLAILEFKKVIRLDPKEVRAYKRLGWIYLERLELRKAIKVLKRIEPKDLETKMLLAQAYGWSKRYSKAIQEYKEILNDFSANTWVLYKLGEVLGWAGRYEESINKYEQILELEPRNINALIGMAYVYGWRSNFNKAFTFCDNALSNDEKNIFARICLADLYRYRWDWDNAINEYNKILRLEPNNKIAKERLEEINSIISPKLNFNFTTFIDSEDFERTQEGTNFQYKLFDKTFVEIEFLRWQFSQKEVQTIYRNDYTIRLKQYLNNKFSGKINYTLNEYNDGREGKSYGVLLKYLPLRKTALYLSYYFNPIIDSILSIKNNIYADIYGVGIDYSLAQRWSLQGNYSIAKYSDNNTKYSRDVQLSHHLFESPSLMLKYKYSFLNYTKESSLYWTPTNFETLSSILEWNHNITKKFSYTLKGGGIWFLQDNKGGWYISTNLKLRLYNALTMLISASYDKAETKVPWLGKTFQVKIEHKF
jgi:tetratricopeptide (TPR) repeat protein